MGLSPAPAARSLTVAPGAEDGWLTTRLDLLVNWARAGSIALFLFLAHVSHAIFSGEQRSRASSTLRP